MRASERNIFEVPTAVSMRWARKAQSWSAIATANVYPAELRERAVRMVAEVRPQYPTEWAAMGAVAAKLGVGSTEALRKWVRQAQVDGRTRVGTTTDEHAEIKRLKRETAELRRANEILKVGSSFFAVELDRPQRFS
jgi:transposase